MMKIRLILTLIVTLGLSSCGFHTPYKNAPINAHISSADNNLFTQALVQRFDENASKKLSITIGAESTRQQTSSYTSAGKDGSYTLTLSVPISIQQRDKVLFLQTLSASKHISKMSSSQADRLQIEQTYTQLRNNLVKQLLRKLAALNAT